MGKWLATMAAAALSCGAALAEPQWTRWGSVEVGGTFGDQVLLVDGLPLAGTEGFVVLIEQMLPWSAESDVVLVLNGSGGTACAALFQFVRVDLTGDAIATEPAGTCADTIMGIRQSPDLIEVDLPSADPQIEVVTLLYDGEQVREVAQRSNTFGARAAGPGGDVLRWDGQHPYSVLEDASERLRFAAIMGEPEIFALMETLSVAVPATAEDGLLFGQGCMAHQCGDEDGAIAIEVATGRPFAVMRSASRGLLVFGGRMGELPAPLRAFALAQ